MTPRRAYGTGQLTRKHGAWYGRWRTSDGRRLNRRIGPVRSAGEADGLTRRDAERMFRKLQEQEERKPVKAQTVRHTVADAAAALRKRLVLKGGAATTSAMSTRSCGSTGAF